MWIPLPLESFKQSPFVWLAIFFGVHLYAVVMGHVINLRNGLTSLIAKRFFIFANLSFLVAIGLMFSGRIREFESWTFYTSLLIVAGSFILAFTLLSRLREEIDQDDPHYSSIIYLALLSIVLSISYMDLWVGILIIYSMT